MRNRLIGVTLVLWALAAGVTGIVGLSGDEQALAAASDSPPGMRWVLAPDTSLRLPAPANWVSQPPPRPDVDLLLQGPADAPASLAVLQTDLSQVPTPETATDSYRRKGLALLTATEVRTPEGDALRVDYVRRVGPQRTLVSTLFVRTSSGIAAVTVARNQANEADLLAVITERLRLR